MSKKNNPTIIRLGLNFIKKFINQNYGNYYTIYILNFNLQLILYFYIINYFYKNNIICNNIEFIWLKKKIFIIIYYTNNLSYLIFSKKLLKLCKQISLPYIKMRLYKKTFQNSTALMLILYSQYLCTQEITPQKKKIILINILNKTIKSSKIVFTNKGPLDVIFIGYKLHLTGRVENTKNQMATVISCRIGKISLITLDSYVDFISKPIYTKLGIYNLNIWLYYKKKSNAKKNA